jgi:hypothetical protein
MLIDYVETTFASTCTGKRSRSIRFCVDALPLTKIRIVEVLVDDVTLLLIEIRRELLWQTLVENLFDRDAHLSPALLTLAPVEDKLFFRNLL